MSLEDLGNIGELVAALGVFISLVYLGFQIRQNTAALKSSTSHEVMRSFGDTIAWLGQTPENASVFHKGLLTPHDLSDDQQTHFLLMMINVFINSETAYNDIKHGTLSEADWERVENTLKFYFSFPAGAWAWPRSQPFVGSEFQKYVETIANDGSRVET